MPDNDLLNAADDFELPPLPKRPAKLSNDSSAPADKDIDSDLPPLPKQSFNKPAEPVLVKSESADDDFELPPLPEKRRRKRLRTMILSCPLSPRKRRRKSLRRMMPISLLFPKKRKSLKKSLFMRKKYIPRTSLTILWI